MDIMFAPRGITTEFVLTARSNLDWLNNRLADCSSASEGSALERAKEELSEAILLISLAGAQDLQGC